MKNKIIPWIEENDIIKHLKNKIIIISHGGVGSEYLTKLVNIQFPLVKINNRPLKGCIVHFPYPPPELDKVIYLYGDIYNSVISQIPRHYDNASKLCNDKNYKHFHNINELINYNKKDPFNIKKQILQFMNRKVKYPIILLKYGFDKELIPILIELTNLHGFKNYFFKSRTSNLNKLNKNERLKLTNIYKITNIIINNSPQLIIRYPKNNYVLSQNDVIKYVINDKFPGKRMKHYKKIKNFEIYNERDCTDKYNNKFGKLRIRNNNNSNIFQAFSGKKYGIISKSKTIIGLGGIEDPRYFEFENNSFVLFNGLTNKNRNMYIKNLNDNHVCKLNITNFNISKIKEQKNWIPYIYLNKLYFIYSLDKLCILKVTNLKKGECLCIKGNPNNYNNNYKYFGSTQLIQWNFPYFIGFVHTRHPWLPCPIIFDAEKLEIVKIGKPFQLDFPKNIIPTRRCKKYNNLKLKIVQFPYDLEIIKNNVILSIEFDDRCPTQVYLDYIGFCKAFSF